MKAILVIDMPSCCVECPCYDFDLGLCSPKNEITDVDGRHDERADWCPLKPMPEKREENLPNENIRTPKGGSDVMNRETIPVDYIQSEIEKISRLKEEEPDRADMLEHSRLTLVALISNWKYTTGWDWRAKDESHISD